MLWTAWGRDWRRRGDPALGVRRRRRRPARRRHRAAARLGLRVGARQLAHDARRAPTARRPLRRGPSPSAPSPSTSPRPFDRRRLTRAASILWRPHPRVASGPSAPGAAAQREPRRTLWSLRAVRGESPSRSRSVTRRRGKCATDRCRRCARIRASLEGRRGPRIASGHQLHWQCCGSSLTCHDGRIQHGRRIERGQSLPLAESRYEQVLISQELSVFREDSAWLVLLPVTERGDAIGLLELSVEQRPTAQTLEYLVAAAHALAYVLIASRRHTDVFEWGQRDLRFSLAAEIQRRLLPSSYTLEGGAFTLAGWLEPASNVGGDTFDYSLEREYLYASITDAMGHATEAALLATLTVGSLRNSRRALASPAALRPTKRTPHCSSRRGPSSS